MSNMIKVEQHLCTACGVGRWQFISKAKKINPYPGLLNKLVSRTLSYANKDKKWRGEL